MPSRTRSVTPILTLMLLMIGVSTANGQTAAPATKSADIKARVTETVVDSKTPDDPEVEKMLAPYAPKVRALNEVIGKLNADMRRSGIGAGTIGNFVADALRNRAQVKAGKPILLSIMNSGGLRKSSITAGDLTVGDIFELLPFENALVTVDLTGEQLRNFLAVVLKERDAQSGARILFRLNERKENVLVSAKLGTATNEFEIDPKATYTIATIDYLVKRGGDYIILQQGANLTPLNTTLRDAVLDYVRAETAAGRPIMATLDGRFRSIEPLDEVESRND